MNRESVRATIEKAASEGRSGLTAAEAGELCRAYGVPLPAERVAADAEAAVQAARAMGYPVALKVLSGAISHKSDAGGIALGLASDDDVRSAFAKVTASAKAFDPSAQIDGVLVQQMARPGREVIVGAITDPTFGKVVMAGLGGIFVETLKDVTFALAPVTKERAREMFAEIKGAPLLTGVRGERSVDFDALCDVVVKVSQLVTDHPEIAELDLNPVIARPDGCTAVDARIALRTAEGNGARPRPGQEEILTAMRRIMNPRLDRRDRRLG